MRWAGSRVSETARVTVSETRIAHNNQYLARRARVLKADSLDHVTVTHDVKAAQRVGLERCLFAQHAGHLRAMPGQGQWVKGTHAQTK